MYTIPNMTIARGQMKRQLYQDGTMPEGGLPSLEDIMEGKISPAELALIKENLEDVEFMQEGYNLDRPGQAMGGLMDTRQAYGFGSLVKSITKPFKKAVSKVGDVVKDIDLEDAAAVAALVAGVPPPVVGATYGATGGDNPLIQAYTAFSQPGGGFSFAPQQPGGFPGTGSGQQFGLADALRFASNFKDDDYEDEKQVYDINDAVEAVLRGMGKGEDDTSTGQTSGFDLSKLIIDQLKKITGRDVAAGAAGAAVSKLAYEDRKRLIEQIEKDIKQQRADVAMFRERFKDIRGTGRSTGAPTGPADVVRRPGQAMGGIMDVPLRTNPQGVIEMDFRETGGFVPPVGIKEKADDIPAMLSNNEFVFTADAVRAAGGGSVNKGAERMYSLMKKLEGQA